MLQDIRDGILNGWVAKVIIGVIVLTFALWGVERLVTSWGGGSKTIAKVNGKKITQDQFNVAYERLKRQMELQNPDFALTPQLEARLKNQTLKMLLTNSLLSQVGKKDGYEVSPDQVSLVLTSMPIFQVNGKFSQARFEQILNALMFTEQDFIAQLTTDMLLNQLQTGIVSTAFALPDEINTTYSLINQKRDIQYSIIPYSKFLNTVTVNDAEQKAYYQKHADQFKTTEQVSLEYIELSLANIQAAIKLSDADLKQYYQQNINNFTAPAEWQIAHILIKVPATATQTQTVQAAKVAADLYKKIIAGEDFATAAKQFSADVISAKNGGILPWFKSGTLGNEVQKTITSLKINQVAAPIRTQYGYEIIKLIAEKSAKARSYDEVKNQVKAMLTQEKAQKSYADASEQLSNLTYSNPDNLKVAADNLHLAIKTTELFTQKGGNDELTRNPKILAAAFSQNVLSDGNNSDAIQLNPTTQIVIRVKQHMPVKLKPFAEVQAKIKTILTKELVNQKVKAYAAQMQNQLQAGKTISVSWQTANRVGRHSQNVNPLILMQAFSLPVINSDAKAIADVALPNGDIALVRVLAIYPGDVSKMTKEERASYQQRLAATMGQFDLTLFTKQNYLNAKVKVVH
jgi:peptidyl-prolyl cis-trans isomerase D